MVTGNSEPMSNRKLFNWLTVELAVAFCGALVSFGILYQTFAGDIQKATVDIIKHETKLAIVDKDVSEVKIKLSELAVAQRYSKEQQDRQTALLDQIDKKLNKMNEKLSAISAQQQEE